MPYGGHEVRGTISYSNYNDRIQAIQNEGYIKEPITVTSKIFPLVTTFSVQKETVNMVLELRCPAGRIMTVCGFNDSGVDPRDFARAPHLYSIPHQFSIRCFGKDNVELSPFTKIYIYKAKPDMSETKIDEMPYGDLSLAYGERFKRKEERYYFSDTIILYGEEILRLLPVSPDIDITRTELFMKCDLFTMEI